MMPGINRKKIRHVLLKSALVEGVQRNKGIGRANAPFEFQAASRHIGGSATKR
jgi:hypothetical protein